MASCKEKSGLMGEDKSVKGEQFQEESSNVKSKKNRLKRAKRTKKSDLMLSECKIIRQEITQDHQQQQCSHMSFRPPTIHGAQRSPPKRGLLHMTLSHRKSEPEITSESAQSCHWESLGRSGSHDDRSPDERTSGNSTAFNCCSKPALTTPGHGTRLESAKIYFKELLPREEVLKQVDSQNRQFPVGRLLQTRLKPHGEIKGASAVPVVGKRKQEVESHRDTHHCRRQHTGQVDSETVRTSEGCVRSRHGDSGRNRLRRKRPRVQNAAVDTRYQEEGCVTHEEDDDDDDDDVPWTERFRPRSCDEVVGNSAAVRKLCSWLKEWRMRADVEERRRRREARRMKEEIDGSWDFGDFEGDQLMEECDGRLCNTLLISGPTGAGKSAAVFACAEQLGFKVLEVNSSSLRSGRLVLSQLRESTQSHQVGPPPCSAPLTHTPVAPPREAPQKSTSSCRKRAAIPRTSSRKKRDIGQKSVTLTHYFRKTGKFGNKHLELPQDTAVDLVPDESPLMEAGAQQKTDRTAGISLVLLEEVDIVFEEDVGFLTAVKSLMSTTKRPIILTANDRQFGETFDGHFEEIRFKTPAVESVVSCLQRMSERVQNVKAEPEHIRFLLKENHGDVRRSVLELEFWARSGGGDTHYHLHNRTLTCKSFTELERSQCVEVLEGNWKKGRSLLYSNLDFLLAPPKTEESDGLAPFRHMDQSASAAGEIPKIDSLAQFLDTMSFVDSYLCRQPFCESAPSGAKMADGLLDEPRDEGGGVGAETSTRGLERCCEILAVVEGLGFHRCRTEVAPGDQDVTRGDTNKTCELSEKCGAVVRRVLRSRAFRYHGQRTAVLTDYLPRVRFICRAQGAASRPDLRFSHDSSDIGLQLPKSLLDLLAPQPC